MFLFLCSTLHKWQTMFVHQNNCNRPGLIFFHSLYFSKRSSGAMDNASAYGAEDCRFDPCMDRFFLNLEQKWKMQIDRYLWICVHFKNNLSIMFIEYFFSIFILDFLLNYLCQLKVLRSTVFLCSHCLLFEQKKSKISYHDMTFFFLIWPSDLNSASFILCFALPT